MKDENEIYAEKLGETNIEDTLEENYLAYGLSVIKDRAIPDVRDGLKPVHRRVLFAMHILKNRHNAAYKKSARIVGDVVGKYHPHGDTAVYDTIVRMAQPFSMKVCLVDGQGNFGSIDADSPAAMRYTESRMTKICDSMFEELGLDTVNFIPNYDGSEMMPEVLPVKYPNLIVNGTEGIAVGLATTIPPHNPIEALNCIENIVRKYKNNEAVILEELIDIMPAPDLPTGGTIHSLNDSHDIWTTGRGKFKVRANWTEEVSDSGNAMIVIDEIPYQVVKAKLVEALAELTSPNHNDIVEVEGVKEIIDESAKGLIRITIEIKSDFHPEIIFNKLAQKSNLDKHYSYNSTVLVNGLPRVIGILEMMEHFISFREEVIVRKINKLLSDAVTEQHVLTGLIKALEVSKVDHVIELIKTSSDGTEANARLRDFLEIDEGQAQKILQLRLQKLTSTQVDDLVKTYSGLTSDIEYYNKVLASRDEVLDIILTDCAEQKDIFLNIKHSETNKYLYTSRHSVFSRENMNLDMASLTKEEDCTVIFSKEGYIRRIPVEEFETQNRGTRGKKRMVLGKKDHITHSINCHSHSDISFITKSGKIMTIKAFNIPTNDKGRFVENVLTSVEYTLDPIIYILEMDLSDQNKSLVFVTENGMIKKTPISMYQSSMRKGGIAAIKLNEGDTVNDVFLATDEDDIIVLNNHNLSIRASVAGVRSTSRNSIGVKAMNLKSGAKIVGSSIISTNEGFLICLSENGLLKITPISGYKCQRRGGKGLKAFKASERTGQIFRGLFVEDLENDIIISTKDGISNRFSLDSFRVTSRTSSGSKVIKISTGDHLADVFIADKVESSDEDFGYSVIEGHDELVIEQTSE
jgi:DNA gyrase subunit A